MLDLTAVKGQVDAMVAAQVDAPAQFEQRLNHAVDLLLEWGQAGRWQELQQMTQSARVSWLLAEFYGPFAEVIDAPTRESKLSVEDWSDDFFNSLFNFIESSQLTYSKSHFRYF